MKKLGLVGGLAWPSTMEYYKLLCEGTIAHFKNAGAEGILPTPPVVIESLVMAETRLLRGTVGDNESWSAYDKVFRDCVNRLDGAGCELAAIASNTPHARYDSICEGINIPLISILEETARSTAKANFKSALVLGTAVTMHSNDYTEALQKFNVEANELLPVEKIAQMQHIIDTEFYAMSESVAQIGRGKVLDYCREFVVDRDNTAVLLACTELPLAFPEHSCSGVFSTDGFNFVNTTVAHVDAILGHVLS